MTPTKDAFVSIAFRYSENAIRIFECTKVKVLNSHTLTYKGGIEALSPVCSCSRFRFKNECPHSKAFLKPILFSIGPGLVRIQELGAPISLTDLRLPEMQVAAVLNYGPKYENRVVVPDHSLGNQSSLNFLYGAHSPEFKKVSGIFNGRRIYNELTVAWDKGVPVLDVVVRRVVTTPLTKSPYDSGYDLSLRIMSPDRTTISPVSPSEDFLKDVDKHLDEVSADALTASVAEAVKRLAKMTAAEKGETLKPVGKADVFESATLALKAKMSTVSPKRETPVVHTVAPMKDWREIRRPSPEQFYVSSDIWEQLLFGITHGVHTLILGPSGSGKTELSYLACKAANVSLEPFNMGAMSEPRTSLIGNTHYSKDKGTWFEESRFVRAIRQPTGAILLDELTRAERGAFNILLPLMDRQGYLALDEAEDAPVIHKGEKVVFLATANIGLIYTGTEAMDKALKERCVITIDMTFPPPSAEASVLNGRYPNLPAGVSTKLVDFAGKQRELTHDGEFVELVSTRMLLAAAYQLSQGMSYSNACKFCIANHFSGEGGDQSDRVKVIQILQKSGELG